VKGWVADGESRERVYDVAGDPQSGADLDLATCTPAPGADQLCQRLDRPDFDAPPAFYYARVVENPRGRGNTYACNAHHVDCPDPRLGAARGWPRAATRGAEGRSRARLDLADLVFAGPRLRPTRGAARRMNTRRTRPSAAGLREHQRDAEQCRLECVRHEQRDARHHPQRVRRHTKPTGRRAGADGVASHPTNARNGSSGRRRDEPERARQAEPALERGPPSASSAPVAAVAIASTSRAMRRNEDTRIADIGEPPWARRLRR
jgi:hypothetical protein